MAVYLIRNRSLKALRDALIDQLDETYDMVYVSQGDKFSDDQVAMIARGDMESFDESTSEWEGDNRYESAKYTITEDLASIIREWEYEDGADYSELAEDFDNSDEWQEVRYAIEERDTSDWIAQLARGSGQVLMRIMALDEDDAFSFQEVKPRTLLTAIGIRQTKANFAIAREIIANASPEYSVCMGAWLASVDVEDLVKMPYDCTEIRITNPGFWFGNMFAGSGWAEQFEGTITIKREDMRTDRDAFGYGWIATSGCYESAFPVEFEPVPNSVTPTE